MKDATTETDQIKISIVPFATQVRLDAATYKDEPWMRYDLTRQVGCDQWGNNCETMSKAKWTAAGQGCVADRDQRLRRHRWRESSTATRSAIPPTGARSRRSRPILPLTADWNALNAKVDAMTPVGNTNVTIGAVWGMATLSSAAPFSQARPPTDTAPERST